MIFDKFHVLHKTLYRTNSNIMCEQMETKFGITWIITQSPYTVTSFAPYIYQPYTSCLILEAEEKEEECGMWPWGK